MKKLFLLFLALSLVFALIACGGKAPCETCIDADGNGKCDNCKKDMPKTADEVLLFDEDGQPLFQIVIAKDLPVSVRQAVNTNIKMYLQRECELDVDVVIEGSAADEEIETEILIGNVDSRGEKYSIDPHTLGLKGYYVRPIGTKLVINAGSQDALDSAIRLFADEFLRDAGDLSDLAFASSDIIEYIPDDYNVTSLKLGGTDMRGYTISADLTRDFYAEAAEAFRDGIYKRTGYWFDIVDLASAADRSIVIKHNLALEDSESFKVYADGTQLFIECAFDNMLSRSIEEFAALSIYDKSGEVDLADADFKKDISVVYYKDFEAVGDGRTDDFKALYDAHTFANISGQTVKATPGATYYIFDTRILLGGKVASIPIRTNTDWQGAKFIIDDEKIAAYKGGMNAEMYSGQIFSVLPDKEHESVRVNDSETLRRLEEEGIKPGVERIDLKLDSWDGELMIIPYNNSHNVYRRRGYSAHSGQPMHEVIIIDSEGNVSDETPIMFDYTSLTYIDVYKLDPTSKITVKNATIETIDSHINHMQTLDGGATEYNSAYKARGIYVTRSYTTVENITHIVSGGFDMNERAAGYQGAASNGMFRAAYANEVIFKNCIIPGRQAYGNHSSYNFGGLCVNKIVLDHCIQPNFWVRIVDGKLVPSEEYVDGAYTSVSTVKIDGVSLRLHWGVGGTNYCKNMEYYDSKISRFDAHQGLYNGKIIRSETNCISITGYGDMIIEDTKWYQYADDIPLAFLRADYGHHWDGDITIKNTDAYLYDLTSVTPTLYLVHHRYRNWYYGYTTAFPNLIVDNLGVYSTKTGEAMPSGYEGYLVDDYGLLTDKMHLLTETSTLVSFDYIDRDGDGFIDEPLFDSNLDGVIDERDPIDVDGNGVVGNTSLPYGGEDYEGLTDKQIWGGFKVEGCKLNVNVVKPPRFIKIINNKAGIVYRVPDTSGLGVSDGGWNREKGTADTMGGFFANTKFIYGEGEGDFFIGTNYREQTMTSTFKFVSTK